jgi:hypothetical protein
MLRRRDYMIDTQKVSQGVFFSPEFILRIQQQFLPSAASPIT